MLTALEDDTGNMHVTISASTNEEKVSCERRSEQITNCTWHEKTRETAYSMNLYPSVGCSAVTSTTCVTVRCDMTQQGRAFDDVVNKAHLTV